MLPIALTLAMASSLLAADGTDKSQPLRVFYVGHKDSDRARSYASFLAEKFTLLGTSDRRTFDPKTAADAEVVILDWSQADLSRDSSGGFSFSDLKSPLGERRLWKKPTVLLGSAGLLNAAPWKVFGGRGCTCLEPFAYDFREHPVFRVPIEIDLSQRVRQNWPEHWTEPHKGAEIEVLSLTRPEARPAMPGWCCYDREMALAPEVEILCGGVNAKYSTAAALWRQGNLMHYGFDLTPDEMNPWGKALLINAISYIARFTEDRPIMETPSPFAGNDAIPRSTIERFITGRGAGGWDYLASEFNQETLRAAKVKDMATFAAWYSTVRDYLHPDESGLMTVDRDAEAAKLNPGRPEFFDRAIADLDRRGVEAERARRMLRRYAPEGPGLEATAQEWKAWWSANSDYLFFGEIGGYRWYIDPLAKARGVPTSRLRGEARASR
jgi:hypothetical protein